MRARLALLLAAALLASCATRSPHPEAFSFGIVGDVPYSADEEYHFLQAIDVMNAEPLAFVVHVGDMKAGSRSPCTDTLYEGRRRQFDRFRHAFFFIPGDNDWVDCRRPTNGAMDPLERLAKLRSVFYVGERALPAGLARHRDYPEIARWTRAGLVFATLNVQGTNDNTGFDAASAAEQKRRGAVNLEWLDESARLAARTNAPGIVVMIHANPFEKSDANVYLWLRDALVNVAGQLRRPLLFIHGDTHWQRVDRPFGTADGRTVANITRLETYGSPWVGWVQVFVDHADPQLFRFVPRPQ